jgi:AcrR family transcriptional regulator
MSRVRTRPTREETREKLFEAAAEVFEEQGIGAASIEAIAVAAGLTRGAFYSNFDDKDDLIIAMLEDHVERSLKHHRDLLARHRDLADFLAALRTAERPGLGERRVAGAGGRLPPPSPDRSRVDTGRQLLPGGRRASATGRYQTSS